MLGDQAQIGTPEAMISGGKIRSRRREKIPMPDHPDAKGMAYPDGLCWLKLFRLPYSAGNQGFHGHSLAG
jgi:hypothetical protein